MFFLIKVALHTYFS